MGHRIRVPWDERTGPSPIPEQVKIPTPWDEKVEPPIPHLPIPGRGKKEKPKRG